MLNPESIKATFVKNDLAYVQTNNTNTANRKYDYIYHTYFPVFSPISLYLIGTKFCKYFVSLYRDGATCIFPSLILCELVVICCQHERRNV